MLERYLAHSLPDPAQTNLWYLTVPFTNGQVYHVLAERVNVTFPKNSFRPRPTDGKSTYFPETTDLDGINVTFFETFDFRVTAWLNSWRKLIRDDEGNYHPPALFKQEMTVMMFNRTNLRDAVTTVRYEGVAPSDQTPFELSYEDEAGRITVEAQFSVDKQTILQGN